MPNIRVALRRVCSALRWVTHSGLAAVVVAATVSTASPALAGAGAQVGMLTCKTVSGTGFTILFHSSVDVECVFKTPDGQENYTGQMGIGLGVDLGIYEKRTIHFGVLAGGGEVAVGSHVLAGKYMGGKASVALVRGVGAAALIGGGSRNVALQPLGLEASTGSGIAAGLGYLFLEAPAG